MDTNKRDKGEHDKNDERFADPQTDEDPRTSDVGFTSVGATDLDADAALVPEEPEGVRRGDSDTPVVPVTPPSVNTDLNESITQRQ